MGRYAFPGMGFVMLWYAVGFAQITENAGEKSRTRKTWMAGIMGTAAVCFLLQYSSELRLEYDRGLKIYETFVDDHLWYICFQGGQPDEMEDEFDYEEVLEFHYMYYDFVIYRLEKKEA